MTAACIECGKLGVPPGAQVHTGCIPSARAAAASLCTVLVAAIDAGMREHDAGLARAARIAQGIEHYDHAEGEPCVRCERDRLREEAKVADALIAERDRVLSALADDLREIARACPCGARPETLDTYPHVTGCPVARASRRLIRAETPKEEGR